MKARYLLLLFVPLMLLTQCKRKGGDNDPGPNGSDSARVLQTVTILARTEDKFIEIGKQTNGEAQDVLALTADWLKTQTDVKSVFLFDSLIIYITTITDLTATFSLNLTDNQGNSYYRGGRGGATFKMAGGKSAKKIENKKVLIYAAFEPFYNSRTAVQLSNSTTTFDLTVLKGAACKPRLVETFGEYGLVIINTHGSPDGFLTGGTLVLDTKTDTTEALAKDKIEQQVGAGMYEKLLNGQLRLSRAMYTAQHPAWQNVKAGSDNEVYATSGYIESLPAMPGTIIFGNMCHSGWSMVNPVGQPKKPIANAFNSRGLISYYNYALVDGQAAAVNDTFAKRMEDSVIYALVKDYDSTGDAHLQRDGTKYLDTLIKGKKSSRLGNHFVQSGPLNYSYSDCIDSFKDGRDQQVYKAACIGDQIWMAQDLNYNVAGSYCYDNNADNCETYGRLYKWDVAMAGAGSSAANPSGVQGVCPSGWHLPSHLEWQKLSGTLGGANVSGGKLKALNLWTAPNADATNSSGFSALPGGVYQAYVSQPVQFNSKGQAAYYWSSTAFTTPDRARVCALMYDDGYLVYASVDIIETHVSVRCVKNK